MKKFFAVFISASLFFSCVKSNEKDRPPAPDPGARIAGNYKVTTLEVDGKKVPLNDTSIFFQLDRLSEEVVTGKMKVIFGDDQEPDEDLGKLHLSSTGNSVFDLYGQTKKVGSVNGANTLSISVLFKGKAIEIAALRY